MTLYFFDTHAHIQVPRDERGDQVDKLLVRARSAGICAILVPSIERQDWERVEELPPLEGLELYTVWGLHPYFVCKITKNEASDLVEELKERVKSASSESRMRAIGECGLDFLRATSVEQREQQLAVLRGHLELARDTGLPLSIHCVKAHGPLVELLRERPTPASVLHAYSGSAEIAAQLVAAGHFISFAANVCIPAASKVHAAARSVPTERLLIETDSPDQTPPARRPLINEPAFIVDVAEQLARLRGVSLAAIASATLANARRVFGLDRDRPQHRE